ncbi:unnamed protein product [Clavelina lepadiformis]|uniref:Uncharacterized protein n=1 Tax=Clavelina lepadiformis TaxID=159417 RepID=A0ABP0F2T5_CLALP
MRRYLLRLGLDGQRKEDQPFGRDLIPKPSVAYLRVGTMRQNLLGLGLDGQRLEPKTFDLLFSAICTAPSLTSNLIDDQRLGRDLNPKHLVIGSGN